MGGCFWGGEGEGGGRRGPGGGGRGSLDRSRSMVFGSEDGEAGGVWKVGFEEKGGRICDL